MREGNVDMGTQGNSIFHGSERRRIDAFVFRSAPGRVEGGPIAASPHRILREFNVAPHLKIKTNKD